MKITLQPYRTADKSYIWSTYLAAMKAHISAMWGWDDKWQEEDFEKSLSMYSTYILATDHDRLGYIQISAEAESTYINMLILEPRYQSQGIGPVVLGKVRRHNSNQPLSLRCFQVNKHAYNFYLKEGFEVIDSDDKFIHMRHVA